MLLLLFALHFASIMQSQTLQAKLFHEMIYTLKGINAIEGFRQQYCWGFFVGNMPNLISLLPMPA